MNPNDRSILRSPLGASLAALCVIILFLLAMMPGLYRSTFTVFQPGASNDESVELLIAAHERNMETDVDRFNGRSFFYLPRPKPKPRPTPPPPPPPAPAPDPGPKPDPVPTYPANYTGPKLIAILGDQAWFRKSSGPLDPTTRIRIGETQHGIEVLSTNAPRGIQVKYNDGGPYDVELIDMDSDPFAEAVEYEMPRGVLEDVDVEQGDHHGEPCPPHMEGVDLPLAEDDSADTKLNSSDDTTTPAPAAEEDASKDLPVDEEEEPLDTDESEQETDLNQSP
ncbi:MAG: hypothetical protein P8L37_04965 [Phycisphaerales bacterium]|nr:hypothetical protein [Phycisphaerales bacterium]